MSTLILIFLFISLCFYVLFGGADFGAGILQLFSRQKEMSKAERKLIEKSMGPVWEANHIWLILMVVILFVAFPKIYASMSINYFIPLKAFLFGVVIRGCSFAFKHYDPVKDGMQDLYEKLFEVSSLWSSFWLGVIAGSTMLGQHDQIATNPTLWGHWLTPFPLAMGLFVCALFSFLAATYLIGETQEERLIQLFTKRTIRTNLSVVISGGLVLATTQTLPTFQLNAFFSSKISLTCFAGATFLFGFQWAKLHYSQPQGANFFSAGQVILILIGWVPLALQKELGLQQFLTAPNRTQELLVIALIFGLVFVLPALIFLLRVFKSTKR